MREGDSAYLNKTVGESDIALFAAVSLDTNPAHFDDEFAAGGPFGKRIAHGMLGAGLISACLGTKLARARDDLSIPVPLVSTSRLHR